MGVSQYEVRQSCAVKRLLGASPFFLLLDTSHFETLLIHDDCDYYYSWSFQAPVTRSWCLHTSSSADPRLIAFHTPLFHVIFQSS